MTLQELKAGQASRVLKLGGNGELRQHFLDMGIIPGAEISFVKCAPFGDPMEFRLHGYELTLRAADAQKIEVEPVLESVHCIQALAKAENSTAKKTKTLCPTELF